MKKSMLFLVVAILIGFSPTAWAQSLGSLRAPQKAGAITCSGQLLGEVKAGNGNYYRGVVKLNGEGDDLEGIYDKGLSMNMAVFGGSVYGDGLYMRLANTVGRYQTYYIKTHNPFDSWKETASLTINVQKQSTDMTWDPMTGLMYGCFGTSTNGYYYATLDPFTGLLNNISPIDKADTWAGVAMDNDNMTVYAVTMAGKLLKVEKLTGVVTEIGDTGLASASPGSAVIDPVNGTLFFSYYPSDKNSGLYSIDKTTAAPTLLKAFSLNEHVRGLVIIPESHDTAVPESPTGVSVAFDGSELAGQLSFTAPSTDRAGNALTGDLNYQIYVNGTATKKGVTTPGEETVVLVTVEKAGNYNFAVTCSNAAGESYKSRASSWVGPEMPTPVTSLTLSKSGSTMTLEWKAPAKGTHDRPLEADHLRYDVIRMPDDKIVGADISETTFTETIDTPAALTIYHYVVVAKHYDAAATGVESKLFALGNITPPHLEVFGNLNNARAMYSLTHIAGQNRPGSDFNYGSNYNSDPPTGYFEFPGAYWLDSSADFEDAMLVTPGFDIKAGYAYDIEFQVKCTKISADQLENGKLHTVSVSYGETPTFEGMNQKIETPKLITVQDSIYVFSKRLMLDEAKTLYFSVRDSAYKSAGSLRVTRIEVKAPKLLDAPAAIENLKALPDYDLKDEATLTFTTPAVSATGTPLLNLTKVEVYRNDELAETLTDVAPATDYTWVDKNAKHGYNKYTLLAYNENGPGDGVEDKVWTGAQLASAIPSVRVRETSVPGEVVLEWDAPETDIHGQPLNPKYVTYTIQDTRTVGYATVPKIIFDNITEHSIRFQEAPADTTQFETFFYVKPVTPAGEREGSTRSNNIVIGKGASLPYLEPVSDVWKTQQWGINAIVGDSKWQTQFTKPLGDYISANHDDEDMDYVMLFSAIPGDISEMETGKIAITGEKVRLRFAAMNEGSKAANILRVFVVNDDNSREQLFEAVPRGAVTEWTYYDLWLDKYAGRDIKLLFQGELTGDEYTGIMLDDITVDNHLANDLRVVSLDIPRSSKPYADIPAKLTYRNAGDNKAAGYTIDLLVDGNVVETLEGEALEPGKETTATLTTFFDAMDSKFSHHIDVVINWEEDDMASNNSIGVDHYNHVSQGAAPLHLQGIAHPDAIELKWQAPEPTTETPAAVTEDFESYAPWEYQYMGMWTLRDEDGLANMGLDAAAYPYDGEPMAWFIFNTDNPEFGSTYKAHSGEQYISTMWAYDPFGKAGNNDWIISPALWGHAQTIKFYARQYHPSISQDFQVLYSLDTDDKKDFRLLTAITTEPTLTPAKDAVAWKEYTFDLPEGTNYFAIVDVTMGGFMLQVDDITFLPDNGSSPNLRLTGYNIWRDGAKVGSVDASTLSFTDPAADKGVTHTYNVTAVYNRTESLPSNTIMLETSGIENVTGGNAAGYVSVATIPGAITIAGHNGIAAVYTTTGAKVATAECDGLNTVVRTAPGIYIVDLGGKAVKVLVP